MKRPLSLIFSGDCDGDAEAQDFTVTKKLYLPDHEDHANDCFRYSFDSFLWFRSPLSSTIYSVGNNEGEEEDYMNMAFPDVGSSTSHSFSCLSL